MSHLTLTVHRHEVSGTPILAGISQIINSADRIALVGPNGVGKTTLLKILMWELTPTEGSVENLDRLTVGYLAQIHFDQEDRNVREELRNAFVEELKLESDLAAAETTMSLTGETEKYLELLEAYQNRGGEAYVREIDRVARGLSIFHLLDRSIREVSGGERTKIALAKILLLRPDFLLLDEPTNFIDLESVEWLELYLQETWKGGYLIVSHDREFLDSTCPIVWEIRGMRGIEVYHGGYRSFIRERAENEARAMKAFEDNETYLADQRSLVNRFRAGSRAGWAASREKALEKMESIERPFTPFRPSFRFEYSRKPSETILKIEDGFIGRSDPLFYIRELELKSGDRVGIVGHNGAGKSTFLKTVLGQIPLLDGGLQFGWANDIAFYSQMHDELDTSLTLYEHAQKLGIDGSRERVLSLLAPYGFPWSDLDRRMLGFSGGERSRFLFAMLGMRPSNVLILDEPTNHLDTESRESLEHALRKYSGTLLFISHDRYFVNTMARKLWVVDDGQMSVCYGNYADYLLKKERGIDYDLSLWNEDGEMSMVLEEKLGKVEARRIKEKFSKWRK